MTDNMPAVIGLTGYAGSGKDLVGALLAMRGYNRIAFADAVRMEVAEFLASGDAPPAHLTADIRQALSCGLLHVEHVWEKPTSHTMRAVLQQWGTEYRRSQDQDYWVKIADDQVKALNGEPVVITDVRYQNECDWVRQLGGVIVRVRRSGSNSQHVSERSIDTLAVDAEIDNTGSLQELPLMVLVALRMIA